MLAHALRKQCRQHGLGIEALEHGHDAVVALRGVELVGELLELIAELARHRVPERDVGRGERRTPGQQGRGQACGGPPAELAQDIEAHRHFP